MFGDRLDYEMNEEEVEAMIRGFEDARKELLDVLAVTMRMAETIENGALRGKAGQELEDTFKTSARKAIMLMADEMAERAHDLKVRLEAWREAINKNRGLFKGG